MPKETMKAILQKYGVRIEVCTEDKEELIEEIAFWQEMPDACTCGSRDIKFFSRRPQDYHFVGIVCGDCGNELNFGKRKSDEKLFPKEWQGAYKGGQGHQQQPVQGDQDGGEIPF